MTPVQRIWEAIRFPLMKTMPGALRKPGRYSQDEMQRRAAKIAATMRRRMRSS